MTSKAELLKIIRRQCVACCGGSISEVQACTGSTTCHLHPFRFGTDPFNRKRVAQKKKLKKGNKSGGNMANIFKSGYVNIESVESVKDDVKIIKKKKLKEDLIEAFPVAARKAPLSMYLLQVCSNFRKCSISPRYTSKIENIEYLVAWDIAFLIEPGSFS